MVYKRSYWSFDGSLNVLKYYLLEMVTFEISFYDYLFWVHVKGTSPKFFIDIVMENLVLKLGKW